MGARTFPEIGGEIVQNAAFTFWNYYLPDKESPFIRLVNLNKSEQKRLKTMEAIKNTDCKWFFRVNQAGFSVITGNPIGYWLPESILKLYQLQIEYNFFIRNCSIIMTNRYHEQMN